MFAMAKGVKVNDNTSNNAGAILDSAPDLVGELTPMSIKEAESVIGKETCYETGESVATAIFDFTAIARAYLRNISKIEVLKLT